MLDAKRLLDQFLGQGAAPGAGGPQGQGGQVAAGQAAGGQAPGGGGGFSVGGLIGDTGSFAKGAAAGGVLGLLLGGKKPKKLAKTALTYGGAALVGGLAYRAWQNWQGQQSGGAPGQVAPPSVPQSAPQALPPVPSQPVLPPPSDTAFVPDSEEAQQNLSRGLIRAMISAAKADGHVTPEEQSRIFESLSALSLERDDQAFVLEELSKPLDIEAVAAEAKSPEQAAEIYAASLLAIDPSGPAERGYLGLLAARLKLEPALVEQLHASVTEAEVQAAA